MDIKNLLEYTYNFSFVPVYLYENGECRMCYAPDGLKDIPYGIYQLFEGSDDGIEVVETMMQSYYGRIPMEGKKSCVVIGPVKPTPYSERELKRFCYHYHIDADMQEKVSSDLAKLPQYSFLRFFHLLRQLGLYLRPGTLLVSNHMEIDDDYDSEHYEENCRQEVFEQEDAFNYRYMRDVFVPYIKKGDLQGMIDISRQMGPINFGKYTDDLKMNQLIVMIMSVTTTLAAVVDGGMPDREAYSIARDYIDKALKAETAVEIDELSTKCSFDFVTRMQEINDEKISHSPLYECVRFVRNNVYSPIKVSDVAAFSGYTDTYFSKKFKKEMGFGAAEFIYECKLIEAANLLLNTKKPVGEISNMLFFADQSHFQRKFRKKYGMTPLEYRQKCAGEC